MVAVEIVQADMKDKAILVIIPFFRPNIGGVETRFDDICNWLSEKGYKVKILTYQPITTSGVHAKSYEKEGNVEIFRVSWPGYDLFHKLQKLVFLQTIYTSTGLLLKAFFYLSHHHQEIGIIHAAGFNSAFIARILHKFFKIRWVMSTHAIYEFERRKFLSFMVRWILKNAYNIIAISKFSKEELLNLKIAPEKIIVHTTWVNQNVFKSLDKIECRKKLHLANKFTVIFVGRLRKNKGVLLLLEVAKSLKDINFIFVGNGPLEPKVREGSAKYKNVFYIGHIVNKELPLYYNAADICVMPSLYKEPFGRVVLEALSCGLPCICSNLGGIVDYLDSSVADLIKPEYETLKRSIEKLYNDREKLKNMSIQCREFAKNKFSDRNMQMLLKGYGFNYESYFNKS